MKFRALKREEIEKVRSIDRREIVKQIYYMKNGQLCLKDAFYNIKGWIPFELERSIKHLYDIYDRNGTLLGAFDEDRLIAVAALESSFIGKGHDGLHYIFFT